jgi:hypothetical protein
MEEEEKCRKVGKPEGKRRLGRCRFRCGDNIKTALRSMI